MPPEPPDPAPTARQPKKLIVCCDGTWKTSTSSFSLTAETPLSFFFPSTGPDAAPPTNVTRLSRAILPLSSDGKAQVVFYQAGVGTDGGLFSRLVAGAIGEGLAANVREAYSFIATNYVDGDEIYLVGFSRGAYTARSVGGLIGDFGLLTRDGLDHFHDIFMDWEFAGSSKDYKSALVRHDPSGSFSIQADPADLKGWLTSYKAALRKAGYAHPHDVEIEAIGVWETVGALGIPINPLLQRLGLPWHIRPYRFFDTALSNTVKHAFQALALDERRSAFYPAVWERPEGVRTQLRQTWFPGVHSSVGGGYDDQGISDITLAWMMSQLAPFVDFDSGYLHKQFESNLRYLERHGLAAAVARSDRNQQEDTNGSGGSRSLWGRGRLYDSQRWMAALLGSRVRSPGLYDQFDRKADRPRPGRPLRATEEKVHRVVRSRMATGGLDVRGQRVVPYRSKALEDYDLVVVAEEPVEEGEEDGAKVKDGKGDAEKVWKYKYTGKKQGFEGRELCEDELGVYERELQGYYARQAAAVTASTVPAAAAVPPP